MDEVLCIIRHQPFNFTAVPDDSQWVMGDRNKLIDKMSEAGFVNVTVTQSFIPFKTLSDSDLEKYLNLTMARNPLTFDGIEDDVKRLFKTMYDQIWKEDQKLVGFNVMYALGTKPLS